MKILMVLIKNGTAYLLEIALSDALSINSKRPCEELTLKGTIKNQLEVPILSDEYVLAFLDHFLGDYEYYYWQGKTQSVQKNKREYLACVLYQVQINQKILYAPCFVRVGETKPLEISERLTSHMTLNDVEIEIKKGAISILLENPTNTQPKSGFYPKR